MGFVKDLGKGLVRSAVNQVGRDGGKVVSNQLYGDAHSTPHRIAGGRTTIDEPRDIDADYMALDTDGKIMKHSTIGIIFRVTLAFCFHIIGGVILLIYGLRKKANAGEITVSRYEDVPTYEQDRRYKGGARYAGSIRVEKKYKANATEDEMQDNIRIANIYIYSGIAILTFFASVLLYGFLSLE